ncbi:MAG: hypothetical protein AAF191_19800 [Verrucomicrobiota bacterium]
MKSTWRTLFSALLAVLLLPQCAEERRTKTSRKRAEPAAIGGTPGVDDTARFLAGMDGPDRSPLASARRTSSWSKHQSSMNELFQSFENRRGQAMKSWRGNAIPAPPTTLFYPFGGPDVLYPLRLFPSASTYVLVGLEGADPLPELSFLQPSDLPRSLDNLRTSMGTVVQHSYFITKDMRRDLASTPLQGALPPILTFLARSGFSVRSIEVIQLHRGGTVTARSGTGGNAPGLRIKTGGKTIYYFRHDLSNGGYGSDRRLLTFLQQRGSWATYLKSASYLLHRDSFSKLRSDLLAHSRLIVSDPSGIPYRSYSPDQWDLALYGEYRGTLDLFRSYTQDDLSAAYQRGDQVRGPLPFGVGYTQTSLIVARRR